VKGTPTMDERTAETIASMVGVPWRRGYGYPGGAGTLAAWVRVPWWRGYPGGVGTGTLVAAQGACSTFFLCFSRYFTPICILNRGSDIRRNHEYRQSFLFEH
jgi:hypothetical protein